MRALSATSVTKVPLDEMADLLKDVVDAVGVGSIPNKVPGWYMLGDIEAQPIKIVLPSNDETEKEHVTVFAPTEAGEDKLLDLAKVLPDAHKLACYIAGCIWRILAMGFSTIQRLGFMRRRFSAGRLSVPSVERGKREWRRIPAFFNMGCAVGSLRQQTFAWRATGIATTRVRLTWLWKLAVRLVRP